MNTLNTQQNDTQKPSAKINYKVMVAAIANAALSRRAALQMELAVSLVHFTQENGGTDATGKANLKAVYHAAGYLCMSKEERDYKTVNRRLNAMAKCFDKIGSSVVHGWIEGGVKTEAILATVQHELAAYGFDTMDDVHEYVGTSTSRVRDTKPSAAPVAVSVPGNENDDGAESAPAPAPVFNSDASYAAIIANMNAEEIRAFCTKLLVHVATVEVAEEQAALPVVHATEESVTEVTATVAPLFPVAAMVLAKGKNKGKNQQRRAA